ncbi:MAG TPA: type II toxin-antitoxin system prevent-host-death family antitoxin [Candidatus Acidoferrum sp.]|nr:type II toxin-antitoxin system prevent-host-death family antitoxin [Candidatus Acidoferrum sp.]
MSMSNRKAWSVQAAQAKLSEILRRARAGEPQMIGTEDPCVVVSEQAWRRATRSGDDFGRWLVKTAPRGTPLELPKRAGTRRGDPFADTGT